MEPVSGVATRRSYLWVALFLAYAALLIVFPAFGPIDDHEFLGTIQQGHFLPPFIQVDIGRFYPLAAQEYSLIAAFSRSVASYYAYNALELLILGVVAWKTLRRSSPRLAMPVLVYMALMPGFVEGFFRLLVPDRDALVFFSLFVFSYLQFERVRKRRWLVLALFTANVAVYYKEPGFLMLVTFALLHLVSSTWLRQRKTSLSLLDGLSVLSGAAFFLAYFLIVRVHQGPHTYGYHMGSPLLQLAKNLLKYGSTDPLIACVLPVALLARARSIISRREPFDPIHDSLLWGAGAYYAAMLAIGIPAMSHYLLPSYAFALPALGHFAERRQWIQRLPSLVSIAGAVVLLNSALLGVHLLSYQKMVPINYNLLLDQLGPRLTVRPGSRPAVFFGGVYRGDEVYASLGEFLTYRGIAPERYDLKCDLPPDHATAWAPEPASAWSAFRSSLAEQPQVGDFLVFSPFDEPKYKQRWASSLQRDYRLVYRTRSAFAIPDWSLMNLGRLVWARLKHQDVDAFDAGMDYYLYQKVASSEIKR